MDNFISSDNLQVFRFSFYQILNFSIADAEEREKSEDETDNYL